MRRDVLLIDNFDSFTYNLADEFECLGCRVVVQRANAPLSAIEERLQQLDDPLLVLSPGPGSPENAGCCVELIRRAAGRYAMLGICLGHQALVVAFGGKVGPAPRAMHGQRSQVHHARHFLFEGLPNPFSAGRYHSLAATEMPACLQIIAQADGVVMAAVHTRFAMAGLQFHPESILTTRGSLVLSSAVGNLRERPLSQTLIHSTYARSI
jgi:anthranilate synthase component 2